MGSVKDWLWAAALVGLLLWTGFSPGFFMSAVQGWLWAVALVGLNLWGNLFLPGFVNLPPDRKRARLKVVIGFQGVILAGAVVYVYSDWTGLTELGFQHFYFALFFVLIAGLVMDFVALRRLPPKGAAVGGGG